MLVATHSGPFHADDVMAWALISTFVTPDAELIRTRDDRVLQQADIVFDVGGVYDPATCRFDHHQATYTGPQSSAGMVLSWLESTQRVTEGLAAHLRRRLVDYLDDVDTGRRAPDERVPCFPLLVEALSQPAEDEAAYTVWFRKAGEVAMLLLTGLVAEYTRIAEAEAVIPRAMAAATREGRNVIVLDAYVRWKPVYFANGGEDHPTEYVLLPGTDGSWRVLAIPPKLGDFAQKRPLPESWAGLTGTELEARTGVPGSVFCHKNRFIAVFTTKEGALDALARSGRLTR